MSTSIYLVTSDPTPPVDPWVLAPEKGDLLYNHVTHVIGTFSSETTINKKRVFLVRGINTARLYQGRDTEWEAAE